MMINKRCTPVCMMPDFSLGLNTDFGNFMNHLEDVENILKSIVYSSGENLDNWHRPIKQVAGHAVGVYAKYRNAFAMKTIENNAASLRVTIKVSCEYFAKELKELETKHVPNSLNWSQLSKAMRVHIRDCPVCYPPFYTDECPDTGYFARMHDARPEFKIHLKIHFGEHRSMP